MTLIIIIAILLVAAIGIWFFLNSQKKTSQTPIEQAAASLQADKPDPGSEYKRILDSLLKLNILIRKDELLDQDMVNRLESIIDDLMVVIPQMMERYPGETLTYEIKKIGENHLYKTVKEFLDLSEEGRGHQSEFFNKTIESLNDVSVRSRDIVEKNETAEFKTMANFLASKFS